MIAGLTALVMLVIGTIVMIAFGVLSVAKLIAGFYMSLGFFQKLILRTAGKNAGKHAYKAHKRRKNQSVEQQPDTIVDDTSDDRW